MPSSAEVAPAPRASGRAAPAPRKPRRSVALLALGMLFGMLGGMLCMAATPKPLDALHAGNCPTQLDFGNAAPPAPALALAKASALGCGDCCFELLPQHFGEDGGQGGWGDRPTPYSGIAPPIRCPVHTNSAALPDAKCFLPLMEPCRHFVFAVAESGRELQVRQQVQHHRADVLIRGCSLCVARALFWWRRRRCRELEGRCRPMRTKAAAVRRALGQIRNAVAAYHGGPRGGRKVQPRLSTHQFRLSRLASKRARNRYLYSRG